MQICLYRLCRVAWGSYAMVLALHALGSAAEAEPKEGAKSHQEKVTYVEDLVYGRVHGAGLLADVAYPESAEPLPAILSVHGGRWQGGHKQDASAIDHFRNPVFVDRRVATVARKERHSHTRNAGQQDFVDQLIN